MRRPYFPAGDYYRPVRNAITAGRRHGNDRAAMIALMRRYAGGKRSANYSAVANGWLAYVREISDTCSVRPRTGRWRTGQATIRVTPDLVVEYPDGSVDAVKLHLNMAPVEPDSAAAMLWLMWETRRESHPGAKPVVLDVRRGTRHTTIPRGQDYRRRLEAEAKSLASRYGQVA
ncbi:MAG TPA: hypothetical protein VGD43_24630 [Micromonospora sp.]